MIIKCPNCLFSGRVPSYAVDSPYNARCPRCRFRFELHTLLADLDVRMLAESEPHSGPGSSSYELKAITDDLGQSDPAANRPDLWGDEQDEGAPDGSNGGRLDPVRSSFPTAAAPWKTPAPAPAVSDVPGDEPWYSRVLQVWGIVFLMWAAMIVVRSLFLLFFPGSDTTSHSAVVPSVVSVLLLVPGAAALFLLVDLGRYIRGLQPPPPRKVSTTTSSESPVALSLQSSLQSSRLWSRLFQSTPSVRS